MPSRAAFPVSLTLAFVWLLTGCVVRTEAPAPAPEPAAPEPAPARSGPGSPGTSPGGGGSGADTGDATGRGYRFLQTRDDGQPVRWSTCEPIEYVVRPDGEPAGARRLLEESIARLEDASGLRFSFAGTTDEGPTKRRQPYQPDRYGARWAPVLVAYSDPDEDARLAGQAAGYGGPSYVSLGQGTPRYVSGSVVLDTEQMTSMGGEEATRAVMLHELGHVLGLAHVEDRGQLMNPVLYGRRVTELQEGDRAGLQALGAGRCYDPVDPQRFSP